jgi:hypothetical protein
MPESRPVRYWLAFLLGLHALNQQALTKKEKTGGFFLFCGKQMKTNALVLLIFYCISSILSTTGWGLSAVSNACYQAFLFSERGERLHTI